MRGKSGVFWIEKRTQRKRMQKKNELKKEYRESVEHSQYYSGVLFCVLSICVTLENKRGRYV